MSRLKYGTTQDYMPNPGDIDNLLRHVRYQVDAWYGYNILGLDELVTTFKAGKTSQIPLLYITGYEAFEFTPEQREALRDYLVNGGTLLGDPALGSPEFVASFRAEVGKMFPDRRAGAPQLDHPALPRVLQLRQRALLHHRAGRADQAREPAAVPGYEPGRPHRGDPLALRHDLRLGRALRPARARAAARRRGAQHDGHDA